MINKNLISFVIILLKNIYDNVQTLSILVIYKGNFIQRLIYTTALSLLASIAMAMDGSDEARLSQSNSEQFNVNDHQYTTPSNLSDETMDISLGSTEYLNPTLSEYETRYIYDKKKENEENKNLRRKFDRHFAETVINIVEKIAEEGLAGNKSTVETLQSKFIDALDNMNYKEKGKRKTNIRQKNRIMKELIYRGIEEAVDIRL